MKRASNSRSAGAGTLIALVLLAGSCDTSLQSVAARPLSRRGYLTFPERVAYQYIIEEVRWRHRIWPKDNPQPKPPLDRVLSREEVEKKVTDYLEKSQVLADYWGQPITAEQLQAEMERMASHTKQPEVLRELFAALGDDPFVIAECLARPVLGERLLNELTARQSIGAFVSSAFAFSHKASVLGTSTATTSTYKLPEISPLDCSNDSWTPITTANAPEGRWHHSAVWTGNEMIVWGGFNFTSGILNTGGRYSPATDSWTATSTVNVPTRRTLHSTVWTGTEIIVWGGQGFDPFNTGGRYNPATDSWTATSIINAPTARIDHTAVWTGSEMIVWGGANNTIFGFNNGARYNPRTDSWTATSTTNAPVARFDHSAVWTGSEMIVWGGSDSMHYLHTGGRYNPRTDSWTPTGLMNVVPGRVDPAAVWTGSEMIVWGGVDENFNETNTGGRYNPATDSWIATNLTNAPSPRDSHTVVWTGSEMIIWGGHRYPPGEALDSGGRYDPAADSWTSTGTADAPLARLNHSAVWTGSEMIIWGGEDINAFELNTGGRYCAQPSTPVVQSAVSRKTHGSVGDFDIPLPLNGTPGIEGRSGGSTNDYTLIVTFLANVSVNGNPQAAVTSGTGTIGSSGVSNGGQVTIADNVVTIPLTSVANAQTINVTLYGVNGSTNFVIPMSVLLGDTNANGTVNASDVAQTKSRMGQQVDGTNFRSDVNANGYIDAVDVSMVKAYAGTALSQ